MFARAQRFQQDAKTRCEQYYSDLINQKITNIYNQLLNCGNQNAFLLISTTSVARITNMLTKMYKDVIQFDAKDLENQIYNYQVQCKQGGDESQTIILYNFFYFEDNEVIKILLQNFNQVRIIIVSSILQDHFNQLLLINLIKYYGSVQLIPKYYTSNQTVIIDELQEKKILLNLCVTNKYPMHMKQERITCFLTQSYGKIWDKAQQISKSHNSDKKSDSEGDVSEYTCSNFDESSSDTQFENYNKPNRIEALDKTKQYFNLLTLIENAINNLDDTNSQKDLVWCIYNLMIDAIQIEQIDFAIKNYSIQDLNKVYKALCGAFINTQQEQLVQKYKNVNPTSKFAYPLLVQYISQLLTLIKEKYKDIFIYIYELVEKSTFLDPSILTVYDMCINKVTVAQNVEGCISILYNAIRHEKQQAGQVHISLAFRLFCRNILKRKNIDYETILKYFKGSLNLLLENGMLTMQKQYLYAVI